MKKVVLSSSLNKRLISRLMSSRPVSETTKNFKLKGSNEFVSRSNDVFGNLKSLEVAHESWMSKNNSQESFHENKDSEESLFVKPSNFVDQTVDSTRKSRRSDALFKKPQIPKIKARKNNVAYKTRQKWIKYSLEDIPLTSNSTNTATALAFIDELRKRKETSDANEKLLFSKPKQKASKNSSSTASSTADENGKNFIKLDHLEFEDD